MEVGALPPVAFPDRSRSTPPSGLDPEAEPRFAEGTDREDEDSPRFFLDSTTAAFHLPLVASGSLPVDQTAATPLPPSPLAADGTELLVAGAQRPVPRPNQQHPPPPLPAATRPVAAQGAAPASGSGPVPSGSASPPPDGAAAAPAGEGAGPGTEELSADEQSEVQDLKKRDREVRQHEQAHMAAAGGYARGGPSYEYTTGPDDRRYATGGEVSIDTSKVPDDPEATIRKAQVVYRAAMAPAEPSSQDRSVASQAKQMEAEARRELAEARREEAGAGGGIEGASAAEETLGPEADGAAGIDGQTGPPEGASAVDGPAVDAGVASLDTGAAPTGPSGQLLNLMA